MKTTNPLSRLTAYAVIVAMLAGSVSPAYAQSDITIDGSTGSGGGWTSGSATTSQLRTYKGASSNDYTDWVQSPLNDRLWVTGGSLTTNNLYQNGALYATGGNINVSSGKLSIASGSYIGSDASLTLGSGATLAITGGSVSLNNGDSINSGKITMNGGTLSFIGGTHTISSASSIANNFSVSGAGTSVSFANADSLGTNFSNSADVAFNGGTLNDTVTGIGNTTFNNTVTNTGSVSQDTVTNNGTLTSSGVITASTNFINNGTIVGDGVITAGTGTSVNDGTISQSQLTNHGTFTSNGQITLTNGLTNNATFHNNALLEASVNNVANATLNSDPDNLGDNVANNGTLNLNADGVLSVDVTGLGTTHINGNLENGGSISQQDITVASGKLVTTNASDMTASNEIANAGIINYTGGTTANKITGAGQVVVTGYVTNTLAGNIDQSLVNNSSVFVNEGAVDANLVNTGTLQGEGSITTKTGLSSNSGMIAQTNLTNKGTFDNTGHINLIGTLTNNTGAVLNTDASLITAANGMVNNGTVNFTNGTNAVAISGAATGITNFHDTVINNADITQNKVTNDGLLTNNAVITATNITNSGTIMGAASGLAGAVANEGTLEFNVASATPGAANISGSGDVKVTAATTLSGTNTYTGGTLISGDVLTVAGQNNVGTGNISFSGVSALQVTDAGSLANNLVGVDAAADRIGVVNDADLTLNGTVNHATDFYKGGTGTMTLAMDSNGYTGNTYVVDGTLVGNTQNINNIVNGTSSSTIKFNDTTDAELNEIATAGKFVQSGSAVLNVQNKAFSAAQVDIEAGTFAANRALTATALNVKNGATLRGNGNITGTVTVENGGTIAPGNSIDTLTVSNLTLDSGSTTAIEINQTASDKIVVTGATNIANDAILTVSNEDSRFFEWSSFDILESGSDVNGTFTYDGMIANFDTSRIEVVLDYDSDPTKVTLTAKRKAANYAQATPAVAVLPRNASQAAHAMDAISTGFGGDITNALLQLEKLGGLNPDGVTLINPNATLLSALNDLNGVLYANSALIPLFNAKTTQVYDRIAQRSGAAKKCVDCANDVWVQYYNQHDRVFASDNSPRFTNNMSGALVGYDRTMGDFLVGAYAGFGKSDLRQHDDSQMDVEDTTFGLYSGYTMGDWAFKGTLFGGVQNYHGKRRISFMGRTADGKYNGSSFGLDLEASYNIPVYSWLNVKPFAGWLNSYAHQQAFTEKDAGALNLHVRSNDQFNSQARLGVRLDGQIKSRFSWYGSVAVRQFVGDDYAKLRMDLNLPNTNMEIISAQLGRTSFGGQLGVNYALTNNWSVFANGDAGINNKSANCYGNVGVAYTW